MPIVADAAVAIRGDVSKFSGDLKKVEGQTQTLGTKLKAALTPTGILAGVGVSLGAAQLINFLGDATNAAAEFADSLDASGVIFGEEMIPQMEAWADAAADNFGASAQEALAAANVIATLGKSAGLAGQDLVDFSQEMVQLGGDLASMFGGTTQDAITAVGAALRGEMEPIRRYGVLLDDATLRDQAFRMGLIDTTNQALKPQQKVLAAQAAILEQTVDAQGNFIDTADGMANTQRNLRAEMSNLTKDIGEALLPVMLTLATFVKDNVIPVLSDLVNLIAGKPVESDEGIIGFLRDAQEAMAMTLDSATRVGDGFAREFVDKIANKLNIDYLDAHNAVREANERTGLSVEELWRRVEAGADIADITAGALGVSFGRDIPAIINSAKKPIEGAMDDALVDPVAEAAAEAHEAAVDEIAEMFDELIGLFSKDDFEQAVEDFHEMLNDPWPDTRRRGAIEATLASEEVAEGLRSKDSGVRADTIAFVNDLIEQYELMAPGALAAGELVNPALQDGLQTNLAQTLQVAEGIAIATGNELDFREWAEQAGLSGLLSFTTGMNRQRATVITTAQQMAGLAKSNLYFDASSGGASSAWTFVNGLAGVLESWPAATRIQNAAQLLKTRSLGGSLPTSGPFSRGPLEAGAQSIGDYWVDVLGKSVAGGLMHMQFAPTLPLTGLGTPPTVAVPQPTTPAAEKSPVNIYGDVNLDLAEESVLDELRELADFGSRG